MRRLKISNRKFEEVGKNRSAVLHNSRRSSDRLASPLTAIQLEVCVLHVNSIVVSYTGASNLGPIANLDVSSLMFFPIYFVGDVAPSGLWRWANGK